MRRKFVAAVVAGALVASPCAAERGSLSETDVAVATIQIEQLVNRYALLHNTDDPAAYAALFTEDGQFGEIKGRDAIGKMAQDAVPLLHQSHVSQEGPYRFGFLRTLVVNPVIEVTDATHATGLCYFVVVVPDVDDGDAPAILAAGTYQDEYRKVDGTWLIAKRIPYTGLDQPGLGKKLGL